jgi:hypothetical protein
MVIGLVKLASFVEKASTAAPRHKTVIFRFRRPTSFRKLLLESQILSLHLQHNS